MEGIKPSSLNIWTFENKLLYIAVTVTSGVFVGRGVLVGFGVIVDVGKGFDVLVAGGTVGVGSAAVPTLQAKTLKVRLITANTMGIFRLIFIQFPP
jgi:hypothetical protein